MGWYLVRAFLLHHLMAEGKRRLERAKLIFIVMQSHDNESIPAVMTLIHS
jgi:hypothetical protein